MAEQTQEAESKDGLDLEDFLSERYHKEGCPEEPSRYERVVGTAVTGPRSGQRVEIVRCCDCGAEREVPDKKE